MFVGITSRRAKKSYNGLENSAKRWEIDDFAMFRSLFQLAMGLDLGAGDARQSEERARGPLRGLFRHFILTLDPVSDSLAHKIPCFT